MLLKFVRAHNPLHCFDFLSPLLGLNLFLHHQVVMALLALLSKLVLFNLALSFDALLARFFLFVIQIADLGAMAVFL